MRLNIKPVSLNNAYCSSRTGRRFMTREGKTYKEIVSWEAKKHFEQKTGELGIYFEFGFKDKRRRDVDDYVKLAQDALTGIAFLDDSQIIELTAKKVIGDTEYLLIEVYDLVESKLIRVFPDNSIGDLYGHRVFVGGKEIFNN